MVSCLEKFSPNRSGQRCVCDKASPQGNRRFEGERNLCENQGWMFLGASAGRLGRTDRSAQAARCIYLETFEGLPRYVPLKLVQPYHQGADQRTPSPQQSLVAIAATGTFSGCLEQILFHRTFNSSGPSARYMDVHSTNTVCRNCELRYPLVNLRACSDCLDGPKNDVADL